MLKFLVLYKKGNHTERDRTREAFFWQRDRVLLHNPAWYYTHNDHLPQPPDGQEAFEQTKILMVNSCVPQHPTALWLQWLSGVLKVTTECYGRNNLSSFSKALVPVTSTKAATLALSKAPLLVEFTTESALVTVNTEHPMGQAHLGWHKIRMQK